MKIKDYIFDCTALSDKDLEKVYTLIQQIGYGGPHIIPGKPRIYAASIELEKIEPVLPEGVIVRPCQKSKPPY